MTKFEKGFVYVLKSNKYNNWYVVRQVGMKSWIAFQFTHLDTKWSEINIRNNGVDLWIELEPQDGLKKCQTDKCMRHSMFDILQYGYFKD